MKSATVTLVLVLVLVVAAGPCNAATLKMPAAPALELSGSGPRGIPIVLRLSDDLQAAESVVKTSPFDKIRYPNGSYTVALLERNIGRVFADPKIEHSEGTVAGDLPTLTVEIVSFDAVIPHPAYKPYTATVVYKATVIDQDGNALMTLTTTGSGQTSKGMMSGFSAKGLAAEAAARAMNDAMTQLLEGLLDAEELSPNSASTANEISADEPSAS